MTRTRIEITLPAGLKADVETAAAEAGLSVSSYVRVVLLGLPEVKAARLRREVPVAVEI